MPPCDDVEADADANAAVQNTAYENIDDYDEHANTALPAPISFIV